MNESGRPATTPKNDLRAMQVLVLALVAGVALFTVLSIIIIFLNGASLGVEDLQFKNILLYVSVGIAVFCILIANPLYNKKLAAIKSDAQPLAVKLIQYRTVLILYMAICEGAALFSVIVFFLGGNFIVLIVTAAMLFFMLRKMPSKKKVIMELELDWEEQEELN